MFEKILVALDRSSEAETILNSALSIARAGTTEMLLVHFIDWQMQEVSPWVGIATLYDVDISGERYDWSCQHLQTEVETVSDWLKAKTEKINRIGIDCGYECHIGNCRIGIGDRAKDWGADVLVIGRRGRRNVSEMLLGSVSNYLIHHAPCSILVIQGDRTLQDDLEIDPIEEKMAQPSQESALLQNTTTSNYQQDR